MSGISIVSDTNPLIYLLDGQEAAFEFLDGKQIWISAITELELYGKKGLGTEEKSEIDKLISFCFVTDLNAEIKNITKDILQQAHVKLPDAIIAATALYLDLPLLSSDEDFNKIEQLNFVHLDFKNS